VFAIHNYLFYFTDKVTWMSRSVPMADLNV
jgi:hypothetical protein